MTKLTPNLALKELRDTQAVIDQALGGHSRISLFCPPCGAPYNTETDKLLVFQKLMQEQQMYPVMWNIDLRDWALKDQSDSVVSSVAQSRSGRSPLARHAAANSRRAARDSRLLYGGQLRAHRRT
jgi:peptidoglycan/xylan/chitin deacetylase (PgdA/CDA1 family)